MKLRQAKEPYAQYVTKADQWCAACFGRGTYYSTETIECGVIVICACVPEGYISMWLRRHGDTVFLIFALPLSAVFWVWTAVLWWRWMHCIKEMI